MTAQQDRKSQGVFVGKIQSDLSMPLVAIIVLNWNSYEDTLACLDSLAKIDYPNYQLVLIDNGSEDESVAKIQTAYPDLPLEVTGENLGFVGGNNLGMQMAEKLGADYMLLLNNDTEVDPQFLNLMVAAAEADAQVGVVGPTIYYYDEPKVMWSAGGEIDWPRGDTSMVGLNQADEGQFGDEPRPVDFVTGCAFLIKAPVVQQVGMLDPRFFAYFEETEWCVRVQRAGYRILHVPQAKIWHKISIVQRDATPYVVYYMTRNRLLFLKLTKAGLISWLNTLKSMLRTTLAWTLKPKWRHKRLQRNAVLRGIFDYSIARWGKYEAKAG
jgi:GT2 family glycosyltransferase